jgi:tetratricopeptide (TPR) repeat protein
MGKTTESIEALVQFLDFASTDAESWIELADLYLSQGLYGQAIFAQEEALIIAPNAWNVSCVNRDGYRYEELNTDGIFLAIASRPSWRNTSDGCGVWQRRKLPNLSCRELKAFLQKR